MTLEIDPYIYGKKIGTILYKDGRIYFEYDEAFRASRLEISPVKLPLSLINAYSNRDELHYYEGLPGVFHDSLPDKFGTKIIEGYFESRGTPTHKLNIIQKLMFVGSKGMGAISYRPSENLIDKHSGEELIDIDEFVRNAQKVIRGEALDVVDGVLSFMDSAASAGGARAKAVIGFDHKSEKMIYGLRDKLPEPYEHWLIKFDEADAQGESKDYTRIEYLYMKMAREVGIDVPEVKMLRHGNLSHYMIKRFDRAASERIHLHSLAAMTHSNINIPKHYSYDNLLRLTRKITGAQSDVEAQFKRMLFNIIGRNQDDHAKNFSFMMSREGGWSISPAYDVTYSKGEGYTREHQLSVKGKTANFTRDDLLSLAIEHSISPRWAERVMDEIADKFSSFSERGESIGIHRERVKKIAESHRLYLSSSI